MNIEFSRILFKRSEIAGVVPTINTGSTFPTDTWLPTDIMVGECFINVVDSRYFFRDNTGIKEFFVSGSTGGNTFTTGGTLVGDTIFFDTNAQLSAYTVDLSTLVTTDNYVTGGTYNPTTEELEFVGTNSATTFNVDVSALLDDTNTFTTGATLAGNVIVFDRNDTVSAYTVDLTSIITAGTSGTSGTSGADGTSGTSGINGTSGSSGTSGVDGTSGSSGTSGADGSSGTSGIDGTSGTSGVDGTSGTSGVDGTSGTSGIDGTSGSSGTSGIDGTSGSSGTSGIDGTSGSSGTSGVDGTSGTSGVNGLNGTSGTSGVDGTSGTSGVNGTSGTSGVNGVNGTSGTSGADGTSGTSGTSGINGLNGSSGTSGVNGTSGSSGTSGTSGVNGLNGNDGNDGAVSGRWELISTTGTPISTEFRTNNSAWSATTVLKVHSDSLQGDFGTFFNYALNTVTDNQVIAQITNTTDPANYAIFDILDISFESGSIYSFNIDSVYSSNGTPTLGDIYSVSLDFAYVGPTGSTTVFPYDISFAISDETTQIVTGTSVMKILAARTIDVTKVRASISTSATTTCEFDVLVGGTTILPQNLQINSGNTSTYLDITGQTITEDTFITVNLNAAGSGATGAKIYILGTTTN